MYRVGARGEVMGVSGRFARRVVREWRGRSWRPGGLQGPASGFGCRRIRRVLCRPVAWRTLVRYGLYDHGDRFPALPAEFRPGKSREFRRQHRPDRRLRRLHVADRADLGRRHRGRYCLGRRQQNHRGHSRNLLRRHCRRQAKLGQQHSGSFRIPRHAVVAGLWDRRDRMAEPRDRHSLRRQRLILQFGPQRIRIVGRGRLDRGRRHRGHAPAQLAGPAGISICRLRTSGPHLLCQSPGRSRGHERSVANADASGRLRLQARPSLPACRPALNSCGRTVDPAGSCRPTGPGQSADFARYLAAKLLGDSLASAWFNAGPSAVQLQQGGAFPGGDHVRQITFGDPHSGSALPRAPGLGSGLDPAFARRQGQGNRRGHLRRLPRILQPPRRRLLARGMAHRDADDDQSGHAGAAGPDRDGDAIFDTELSGKTQAGRHDPKPGRIKEYPLKTPHSGPHGLVEDQDGNIWYTANAAGLIGKLDPKTGEVSEYPMPDPTARDPHTLIFDPSGILWFSVQNANKLGRLDPKTGEIKLVTPPTAGARPYGLAVNSKGIPFFVEFGAPKVGSIDPKTMEIREYPLPDPGARPRRIAITSDDVIWYTDFARGYLGRLDPATGKVTEWPSPGGPKSEPYGISAIKDVIWYSESGTKPNTVVRFDPKTEKFQAWVIPGGGNIVRNTSVTREGNFLLANSLVNEVSLVEIKGAPTR